MAFEVWRLNLSRKRQKGKKRNHLLRQKHFRMDINSTERLDVSSLNGIRFKRSKQICRYS